MSSKVRIELNYKGVSQLLHSPEMESALLHEAAGMAARAGAGYEALQMPTRVIAVQPYTDDAADDNMQHNTLLKARRGR